MRLLLLTSALLLSAFVSRAQGTLKFDTESYDFKNVSEGTLATHEFKFTNTGNAPIVISNVQASCGCTTPEWTKDPVLPGKAGIVKAVYNSNGRPGVFNKTITVTSNATQPSVVLSIKGTVLTRDEMRKNYTPEQVMKSAKLNIVGATEFAVGKLEPGRSATARFTVQNTGRQDLNLDGLNSPCNCVAFKKNPPSIRPGESATIEMTYTPRDIGERTETVMILSNDITQPDVPVKLKANVVKSLAEPSIMREADARVPFK